MEKNVFSFIWIVEWENYGIVKREKNLETNIDSKVSASRPPVED
jgi:hypothetical protein